MSAIMVKNREDITNNLGKLYISVLMGISMILVEIMMHDYQYSVISYKSYIAIGVLVSILIYMYRKQIKIGDKEYIKGMIEHHSMALLTSEEILKKTNDYNVAKLAKNIIQTQKDELRQMHGILKEREAE
jgi:Ca2+/Na+ antiporter